MGSKRPGRTKGAGSSPKATQRSNNAVSRPKRAGVLLQLWLAEDLAAAIDQAAAICGLKRSAWAAMVLTKSARSPAYRSPSARLSVPVKCAGCGEVGGHTPDCPAHDAAPARTGPYDPG